MFFDFVRRKYENTGRVVSFHDLADHQLLKDFLFHVKEDRGCIAGTLAAHCTNLVRGVRYLRDLDEVAPDKVRCAERFLTETTSHCQRDAEHDRARSKEILQLEGKWLDW